MELAVIIGLIGFAGLLYYVRHYLGAIKFVQPQTTQASRADIQGYEAVQSVFVTRSELALFSLMQKHLPHGYHLHAKTRLEDIITVSPSINDSRRRWQLRGRVKSRHVDFLVTDLSGTPVIAIELDGSSHDGKGVNYADEFKDGVFDHIGLKLKRVRVGEDYAEFSKQLARYLSALG